MSTSCQKMFGQKVVIKCGQVYIDLFLPLRASRPDFRKLVIFDNLTDNNYLNKRNLLNKKITDFETKQYKLGQNNINCTHYLFGHVCLVGNFSTQHIFLHIFPV